ncbi:hypothetical protein JCM9534A_69800 [Catenuloplanes indicus JCM 9534]
MPAAVTSASQAELTDVPAGRSNATVHELNAAVPPFVTVTRPSHPEPQSDVFVNVAVFAAAAAGPAVQTTAAPATTSADVATNTASRVRLMAPPMIKAAMGVDRRHGNY